MATSALLAGLTGALQGYDYMKGHSDPLAEAQFQHSLDKFQALKPMYEEQTRTQRIANDQSERTQQLQRAQQHFAEADSMAREMGGFSNLLGTPMGRRTFLAAYNSHPDREELGAPQIDDFGAINRQNFQDFGFTPEDFQRMQQEQGSEALFVPIRNRPDGTREPVLQDLDGDGDIDAYGGEQLEQLVRPYFMTADRAAGEYGALVGDAPSASVTIGGGRQGGRQTQPQAGAPSSLDAIWRNMIQTESKGQQFSKDGTPLTSPAGAIGIAQVMPDTAPEAAAMAGLEWDEQRYRNDPEYNEALGRAYFEHQYEQYQDPVLAAAAYNGGAKNVNKWIQRFGDPRTGETTREEFVRNIPFAETQEYVIKAMRGASGQQPPPQQPQEGGGANPLAEPSTTEALTPTAITAAERVDDPTLLEQMPITARKTGGLLGNRGSFTEQAREAAENPDTIRPDPELGFESEEEFKSALARRTVKGQGMGPGSASRAASSEEVTRETAQRMTPEREREAASNLLGGLQASPDGTTFTVQSNNSKPTHKQIGDAYSMYARGNISHEEFKRFISTGTISAEGAQTIRHAMTQAAGVAETALTQEQQTRRTQMTQQGQNYREELKQRGKRSVDTATDFANDLDTVGPMAWGDDWEDVGTLVKQELGQGVWKFRHELLGTPNDTHSLAQGHRRLTQLEDEVNPAWWNAYRRIFKGHQIHDLSAMPSMQALASLDSGLFADEEATSHTLRTVERYREIMERNQDPNIRSPKIEAQSLVNFYQGAKHLGVDPRGLERGSADHDGLMEAGVEAAKRGIPIENYLDSLRGGQQ